MADYMDVLTGAERSFMRHMSMWGSEGYPVQKLGRKWFWTECYGVKGAPVPYKTKREAFAAIDAYRETLRERSGKRAQELAMQGAA